VKQQTKVEDSQRAMAQYREAQNALSLEERQNIVVSRLNQLNDAVTKAKLNLAQKEALNNQINALGADVSADTIPALLQNAYIQTIKTRLAELQREKATLLERYGEKYPDVMKVNVTIQDASRQLQAELMKATEPWVRLSVGAGRGANARGSARRAEGPPRWTSIARASATPCSKREADSNRKDANAAAAREGAAGAGQQPWEQRQDD
jgi:hypothetical protein